MLHAMRQAAVVRAVLPRNRPPVSHVQREVARRRREEEAQLEAKSPLQQCVRPALLALLHAAAWAAGGALHSLGGTVWRSAALCEQLICSLSLP